MQKSVGRLRFILARFDRNSAAADHLPRFRKNHFQIQFTADNGMRQHPIIQPNADAGCGDVFGKKSVHRVFEYCWRIRRLIKGKAERKRQVVAGGASVFSNAGLSLFFSCIRHPLLIITVQYVFNGRPPVDNIPQGIRADLAQQGVFQGPHAGAAGMSSQKRNFSEKLILGQNRQWNQLVVPTLKKNLHPSIEHDIQEFSGISLPEYHLILLKNQHAGLLNDSGNAFSIQTAEQRNIGYRLSKPRGATKKRFVPQIFWPAFQRLGIHHRRDHGNFFLKKTKSHVADSNLIIMRKHRLANLISIEQGADWASKILQHRITVLITNFGVKIGNLRIAGLNVVFRTAAKGQPVFQIKNQRFHKPFFKNHIRFEHIPFLCRYGLTARMLQQFSASTCCGFHLISLSEVTT
ncbi:MAG: hypothetical protein PHG30_06685 [Eubacteriales bacterium]|nr:hypothetical protein [Eubacteriales bacterium]